MILCKCGCGKQLEETDLRGRKRKYIRGHHKSHLNILHSEESRKKMSSSAMGIHKGSKNKNWKGGKKSYWSREIKTRDDYTCQVCGHREPEIVVVDHIKPKSLYPELKFEPNNMLTLCPNCHARKTQREKRDKIYGNTRKRNED